MKRLRPFGCAFVGALALVAGACTPSGGTGTTNLAPSAVVTATPDSGFAPLTVDFSSAGSTDPEGKALTYSWNFGDGSAVSTDANPTHIYTLANSYVATLTVKDPSNASGSATKSITVNAVPNDAPTAVLDAAPLTGKVDLDVHFDGSGSTDPDGTIDTYAWDFGDGATASTAVADHTFTTAGLVSVTLTVTDDDGASNTASQVIEVTPNQAPTAVANGSPLSGKEPLVVQFSSAGSLDGDGTIESYSWDFDDGTADSSAANPLHTYTTFGNFTAVLTVTDDNGDTATNSVTVNVAANQPPVAVANATPSGGYVPLTVAFVGSGSSDPDGSITAYSWNFDDGSFSNFPNPSHTYGAIGTYNAALTVTDSNGVTATDVVEISVNGVPNVPPTASASGTPSSGKVPLTVSFSSTGSLDTDGSITGYAWDFGDGTGSALANPSHVYSTPGTRVATLTVTDNNGATATETVTTVINPNQAPTAGATGTPTTGKEPLNVAFSSATSSDPDGTLTGFNWDFGDGSSSNIANPSHLYTAAGNYTATLTVTDDNSVTATATVSIVVNANVGPTAVLNANPLSGRRPLVVSFDSSNSVDPDGSIASRSLNFGDGSPVSTATTTTHTYAVGTWTASLTVTDDNGATSTSTQVITVVIDDDTDGVSPPTDCDDSVAATYPGAPDALDGSAVDSNCDGIDGVLSDSILVSAAAGSDTAGCGTAVATPCQTITKGIAEAGSARHAILVTNGGSYGGFALTSKSNLTVRGGYGSNFKSRSGTTTSTSGVTVTTSTGVVLRDMTLIGPGGTNTTAVLISGSTVTLNGITAQSGTASGAGSSAYGVRAIASSAVTVQNSNISASAGIAGTAGSTPTGSLTPGTNGGNGTTGGGTGATAGGTGANNGGNGGNPNGGSGAGGSNGGAGGGGGCNNCTSNSNYSGGGAGGGGAGPHGSNGGAGSAGAAGFAALYTPSNGTGGATAANGGGGGGGGGGGQACDYWACAGSRVSGGSGAKGGGGGQGGGGGSAGTSAGGSFAVYSQNSTVAIDGNTTLVTANGGAGGAGAVGQTGASGGSGGTGGSGVIADCCTGSPGGGGGGGAPGNNGGGGGNGGAGTCCNAASGGGGGGGGGGNGGKGGTGGGGAGGPSVAMLAKGTGGITFGGNLTSQVTIGAGGAGGSAPAGNAGPAGATAKQLNVA